MDEIISANDPANYLENIGMDITRQGDGTVKIKMDSTTGDGDNIFIIVEITDIPEIIGKTYHANTSIDDVFDEYVIERIIE